jgi:hypothetical protein
MGGKRSRRKGPRVKRAKRGKGKGKAATVKLKIKGTLTQVQHAAKELGEGVNDHVGKPSVGEG